MSEDDFTPGDAVQHKTGGPKMIYIGEDQLGNAMCEWMDKGSRKQESVPYVALKKYAPPPIGGRVV